MMRKTTCRGITAGVSIPIATWLFLDASEYRIAKADLENGRARGCYTTPELALGAKHPTFCARPFQFTAAAVLGIYGISRALSWPKHS